MKVSPRLKAKKTVYRWGIFCLIALIPIILEGYFLMYVLPMAANMAIIIVTLLGLYFIFYMICKKIDKRREEKESLDATRDPFSK